jgi:diguanylate cyclase (GGDEF)-like protein/PAS domain S-box-containing protein
MGANFSSHCTTPRQVASPWASDDSALLHELQVHQAELEAQNQALREVQTELEIARDRYLDLYESAPVGYLTLDANQAVEQVNLTAARLFGLDRAALLGVRFDQRVAPEQTDRWHQHARALLQGQKAVPIELTLRRGNGSRFAAQLDAQVLTGAPPQLRLTLSDISERKRTEAELRLAFYDPLTGLPNRRLLKERLQQAIATSVRLQREGALMFIDLDHFKDINDTLGHDAGDRVLEWVGQRLSRCVCEGDTVARLGGDEFVLLLRADPAQPPERATALARAVAEQVLAALAEPCVIGERTHRVGASIGVVLFRDAEDTVSELLRRADLAMYQAKAAGRGTLCFFDAGAGQAMRQRTELEAELAQAVPRDELRLLYQPVVDAAGRVCGAEALVRWQHPQRGLLGPDRFIPIAEDRGLIHAIGHWVLERACTQLARWADDPALAGLSVAVNVSARELRHVQFIDSVLAVLARTGANPRRLKLELTETVLLDNLSDTVVKIGRLRALGVRFALDDFGTGYASMTYLRRLPLDELKIDRSFVQGVLEGGLDATIARSLLDLGRNLSVPVVAEGVETAAQHAMLLASGCTAFQGYLFGRPGPVEALEAAARAQTQGPSGP